MGHLEVSSVLVIILALSSTLPRTAMVQAKGSSVHAMDSTIDLAKGDTNIQRRQALLDKLMAKIGRRHTGTDADDLNTQLNALSQADTQLNTRLNGVDARLNRLDSFFYDLEKKILDMKEVLLQKFEAIEAALASKKRGGEDGETGSEDNQPTRSPGMPKDCQEVYTMGHTSSGVYTITPEPNITIDVLCEQELDGGGWLVFQNREDGSVDFYKDWRAYKMGFGELTSEFWLGNANIHLLSKHFDQQLKIELTSAEGEVKYASYTNFSVADEDAYYQLTVKNYSGGHPPGNCMSYHNGVQFSTKDVDRDGTPASCARQNRGGWWYRGCHLANLNGQYNGINWKGLVWAKWKKGESLKGTRMMMKKRP